MKQPRPFTGRSPAPAHRSFGAVPHPGGVVFRVWAPAARHLDVVLEPAGPTYPMRDIGDGCHETTVAGLRSGALYRFRVDGGDAYPDPASRFQPQGVHGPSMVIDPLSFAWHDEDWKGCALQDLVFYELHVGTFTPEGTFAGVGSRLSHLRDLGVTAIELMPVADFPGRWNWGYDGAALFAPAHVYGTPDDLRALVDESHRCGMAVFLDVVYNHFGPDGAYAPALSSEFFSNTHRTLWGAAINFDGAMARTVRRFFMENALHWLTEYHFDGLRLDAIHAIVDDSPLHILRELAEAVRTLTGPKRYLVAEDHRNLHTVVRPPEEGGYGLDAVWNDDYHHQARRVLTGDADGYFADFTDSTTDLGTIVRRGWLFTGQYADYFAEPRGTDPHGIPPARFVNFIQNHDQVGNRPLGQRLTATASLPQFRAASALLLFAPQLPLLFMGQEWAAATPFCYFTDHSRELGRLVTEGRRKEFSRFVGFHGNVADPQDPTTFTRSKLDWNEPQRQPHAGILRLNRDLLRLRRQLHGAVTVDSPVEGGLVIRRGRHVLLVALRGGVTLPAPPNTTPLIHTENPRYSPHPIPPYSQGGQIAFPEAAAVVAVAAER